MPQSQEKKKVPINTQPGPGLMERLFGSVMTPEMQQGIDIAKRENPKLGNVQPYGPISRLIMGSSEAYTNPNRNMYLNTAQMQGKNPQEIADTITHEQTHVQQMRDRSLRSIPEFVHEIIKGNELPYHQRPDEIEAYESERIRRAKMNRMQVAIPNPATGEFYVPQSDINLPVETGPSSFTLSKIRATKVKR